jgi:signal transduction histidine kinase
VVRPNRALAEFLGVPQAANISFTGGEPANSGYRLVREGRTIGPEETPLRMAVTLKKTVNAQEYRLERPDGSVVDVLGFAAPVFEENGRVRGALAAYVDITERKAEEQMVRELEQRLRRSERMQCLGVMAAGMAHDFNNLLTGMIGQASLAADILPPDDEAQVHIAACLEAGLRAAELVKKVTAYTGASHHQLRPVHFGELVRENKPMLLSLAGPKAELRCHIADPLPTALADPDEARHALVNLVLNAVEAAEPRRNHIHIRVESCELRGADADVRGDTLDPGLYVKVEVSDDSRGMPPDIAERAFDPFFTTKFLGRGLGLSEVLGIMRSHHGGVRMETSPDSGTTIRLYFPAQAPVEA